MNTRAKLVSFAVLCLFCGGAFAQSVTGTINAAITLDAACEVNGSTDTASVDFGDLLFGNHSTLFATADAEVVNTGNGISVQCTPGTSVALSFNGGLHAADADPGLGLRAMEHSGGAAHVTYNLYDTAIRDTPLAVNGTLVLTADGTPQVVEVFGRAFGEDGLASGTYSDTIGVTLTF